MQGIGARAACRHSLKRRTRRPKPRHSRRSLDGRMPHVSRRRTGVWPGVARECADFLYISFSRRPLRDRSRRRRGALPPLASLTAPAAQTPVGLARHARTLGAAIDIQQSPGFDRIGMCLPRREIVPGRARTRQGRTSSLRCGRSTLTDPAPKVPDEWRLSGQGEVWPGR